MRTKAIRDSCRRVLVVALLLASLTGVSHGDVEFAESAALSVETPQSVVSGDFDGDGHVDLAIASTLGSSVVITLGDGTGGFGPMVEYATGSPFFLVVDDVNNDAVLDLIAANIFDASFTVLLGVGDGTFIPQTPIPCGNAPTSLATADLNEDGSVDLAVTAHGDDLLRVFYGNGDGTFSASLGLAFLTTPVFVVSGEFTGDSHLDLVVSNSTDSTFGLLHGDGTGGFPTIVPFNLGIDDSIWFISTHDLNQDGLLDLVIPCPNQDIITFMLATPGGGFAPSVSLTAGQQPRATLLADFTLNGAIDVAAVNAGSDELSFNEGDLSGGFDAAVVFSTESNCVSLTSIDVNSDGALDVVVANSVANSLQVFVNASTPSITNFRRGDATGDGVIDLADPILLLGALFGDDATPTCQDAADFDDDGTMGIGDVIQILDGLFSTGSPFGPCTADSTDDTLPYCYYPATSCAP